MYSVNQPGGTHYQILGITRNAKPHEVKRAYDRIRASMRAETAPPDARRMVQVQTAYEVLSDEARRATYDEELRRGPMHSGEKRRVWIVASVAAACALGIAGWFASRASAPPPRTGTEILSMVTTAVGRVHAIDVSGHDAVLGLAFSIGEGRLATRCNGLAPNMELVVRVGSRDAQAHVMDASGERGYCLLSSTQAGSWPLSVAIRPPGVGDKVYGVRVSDSGEVSLLEGTVRRIERVARGEVLQVSGPAAREESGGPLLDLLGRAVGIADGHGRWASIDGSDAR